MYIYICICIYTWTSIDAHAHSDPNSSICMVLQYCSMSTIRCYTYTYVYICMHVGYVCECFHVLLYTHMSACRHEIQGKLVWIARHVHCCLHTVLAAGRGLGGDDRLEGFPSIVYRPYLSAFRLPGHPHACLVIELSDCRHLSM